VKSSVSNYSAVIRFAVILCFACHLWSYALRASF